MMISGPDNEILPLRRLVSHLPYVPASLDDPDIQCDVNHMEGMYHLAHTQTTILVSGMVPGRTKDVDHLKVATGLSHHMTLLGDTGNTSLSDHLGLTH